MGIMMFIMLNTHFDFVYTGDLNHDSTVILTDMLTIDMIML